MSSALLIWTENYYVYFKFSDNDCWLRDAMLYLIYINAVMIGVWKEAVYERFSGFGNDAVYFGDVSVFSGKVCDVSSAFEVKGDISFQSSVAF